MTQNILIIDDDVTHQMMVTSLLKKAGYNTAYSSDGAQALFYLEKNKRTFVDLVLLDLEMPKMNGIEVLQIIKQHYPELPVIMLTGSKNINDAINAMKVGAADFINKPANPEHLKITVKNAIKINSLQKEVSLLKKQETKKISFEDIIGANNGLLKTINIARRAAVSNIPVLITGETGVGKSLISSAIHNESDRKNNIFVEVNCASIAQINLQESLFGGKDVLGKFQQADGGTICLYEVSELPMSAQAKLLKILKEKQIETNNQNISMSIDVRIISTSSKNLVDQVRLGKFREDLYFYLNVLNIDVPSLTNRTEDILSLINHFIRHFSALENLPLMSLSKQSEEFLKSHVWSGNVRELENVIHRAMLLSDNYVLDVKDFAYAISAVNGDVYNKEKNINENNSYSISILQANGDLKNINDIEKDAIKLALKHHNNNITQAAKSLGIAKSTFYKKLKFIKETN